MERVYHHVSILRNKLFCSSSSAAAVSSSSCGSNTAAASLATVSNRAHRRRTTQIVRRMDPMIRSALVTTIQEEIMTQCQNDDDEENDTDDANGNSNVGSSIMDSNSTPPLPTTTTSSRNRTTVQELQEIDHELQVIQEQLEMAIRKEQFISQRSHTYQKVLEEQAFRIQQQQLQLVQLRNNTTTTTNEEGDKDVKKNVNDIEAGWKSNDMEDDDVVESKSPLLLETGMVGDHNSDNEPLLLLQERQQKWEQNVAALASIRDIHLQLLTSMETLRREMIQLQQRKSKIERMYTECTSFLNVAAVVGGDGGGGGGQS